MRILRASIVLFFATFLTAGSARADFEAAALLAQLTDKAQDTGLDAHTLAYLVPRVFDHGVTAEEVAPLVEAIRRWGGAEWIAAEHWRLRFRAHVALARLRQPLPSLRRCSPDRHRRV